MTKPVLVVGHKNPDNDSICSAIAYAYLKNEVEKRLGEDAKYTFEAVKLGPLPPESKWLLEKHGIPTPRTISHVHARVKDVMTKNPISIEADAKLIEAGQMLRMHNVRALVVTNLDGTYRGLITTRMIAERYISATDRMTEDGLGPMAVAADLIDSLEQSVSEITETNVLVLNEDDLLKEAIEDLMNSSLREAVVLDDDGVAIGIVTRSDVATSPRRNVILVDHNELSQAANGMTEANIIEVIDHHRVADISTANPIKFMNLPVGCTATIVTMEFRRLGVEIPRHIGEVLLSAIMTDTVILKSPTTADHDREQVAYLEKLLGVDYIQFGLEIFKTRGGEGIITVEKMVGADAKEFQLADSTVLISQHETVDLEGALEREEEIREHMRTLISQHGYEFVLFLITDIMAEGSVFLCEGNRRIVNRVFGIKCEGQKGGTWMPGILSRKKQVASRILDA